MKLNTRFLAIPMAFALLFVFTACEDDPTLPDDGNGEVRFEITDAPLEDPNVAAVFVTVAEVRVDGQKLEGISKTTVELSALQNGRTAALGTAELAAGTYQDLEIVLDNATDAQGNSPGCYVLTDDGQQLALTAENNGVIRIDGAQFSAAEMDRTDVVIDFDLRKALRRSEEMNDYSFATGARLRSALRAEVKAQTGTIEGSVDESSLSVGTVVAYAYPSGTYQDSEAEGASDARFLNATTSARVDSEGKFKLSFLPEGDYELIFAAYEDSDRDGRTELAGRAEVSLLGNLGLDLGSISVTSNVSTQITLRLTGLLP